jgi:hypothetical protein
MLMLTRFEACPAGFNDFYQKLKNCLFMDHSPEKSQRIRAHQLKDSFPVGTEFTSIEEFAGLFSQSA